LSDDNIIPLNSPLEFESRLLSIEIPQYLEGIPFDANNYNKSTTTITMGAEQNKQKGPPVRPLEKQETIIQLKMQSKRFNAQAEKADKER
jgi:hypothetical protein